MLPECPTLALVGSLSKKQRVDDKYKVPNKLGVRMIDKFYNEEMDIELVMQQTGVSREIAEKALKDNNGDVVKAVMDITK